MLHGFIYFLHGDKKLYLPFSDIITPSVNIANTNKSDMWNMKHTLELLVKTIIT